MFEACLFNGFEILIPSKYIGLWLGWRTFRILFNAYVNTTYAQYILPKSKCVYILLLIRILFHMCRI